MARIRPIDVKNLPPEAPVAMDVNSFLAELGRDMERNGFQRPATLQATGKIERYGRNGNAWYVAWADGKFPAASYGDWSSDKPNRTFTTVRESELSAEDLEQYRLESELRRRIREEQDEQYRREAAQKAARLWGSLREGNHPYLEKKGLQGPHGTRVSEDRLVVPVYNADGMAGLQFIDAEGGKRFLPGTRSKGGYFRIGEPEREAFLCEGFATAASVYEATGTCTFVCFSANNLANVARMLCDGGLRVTIVADNDRSMTGEREARRAVEATGCSMVLVPEVGMDANDYATSGHDLRALLSKDPADTYLSFVSDIVDANIPQKWLIKGVIPEGRCFGMVFGESGSGKSFLAIDMMLHIATGTEWCGNKVKKADVIYLCGEGSAGAKRRIRGWMLEHGMRSRDLSGLLMADSARELDSASDLRFVRKAIELKGVRPGFIVIDTLARFMAGDENDTQDANALIKACESLAEDYDADVCLIHHSGLADPNRARGSSSLRGAISYQYKVSKNGNIVELSQPKNKDGEEREPMYFSLDRMTLDMVDEDGDPMDTAVLHPAKREEFGREVSRRTLQDVNELRAVVHDVGKRLFGRVGLSRGDWKAWLETVEYFRGSEVGLMDAKQSSNWLNPNRASSLVNRLEENGFIVPSQTFQGWEVSDGKLADELDTMLLGKGCRKVNGEAIHNFTKASQKAL